MQITEAFPWDEAPRYLIRDRDAVYGSVVTRRLRAMGIRDKPTSAGSPWQNCFAERLIGTVRRECVDHLIVLGEAHLHQVLIKFAAIGTTPTDTPSHTLTASEQLERLYSTADQNIVGEI